MSTATHRHDISDKVWALLEPHLLGQKGQWGGIAEDNRRFSMVFFGFCVQVLLGVICHPIMEIGTVWQRDFAVG